MIIHYLLSILFGRFSIFSDLLQRKIKKCPELTVRITTDQYNYLNNLLLNNSILRDGLKNSLKLYKYYN